MATRHPPADHAQRATDDRSQRATVAYLAFLGIVMAVGVDIALPAFARISDTFSLSNGDGQVSLVGTTYFLGMATGQLVFGPASDRFGRRRCLQIGIVLAAIGALGAAIAPSFTLLLVARGVWGLGAAAPAVLRTAIARDLFDGDEMARVVTVIMAVFLIGPIFVPSFGQLILASGSWRAVFVAALVIAAVGFVWTLAFGETLRPEDRRPLAAGPLLEALGAVVRTRATVGYILAQTFATGAFVIFLGSGQPIIDRIYGRGSQFALFFGIAGTVMSLALVGNNRLIRMHGARTMALVAAISFVTLATGGLVMMLLTDGRPPFAAWFVWLALSNSLPTLMSPMCNSLALEPMGRLAGTASAILGFVTLAGGALLAQVFDSMIDRSVTPMAVGYVVYGSLALAALLWARSRPGT